MAKSPTHKFGQIIGFVLERAVEPHLKDFARRHGLYLDTKGSRAIRGKKKKITWTDLYQNTHDLDYVLERGGTSERLGIPVAFIETAWRRYSRHSRNKAQEIQGAILPLKEAHSGVAPFVGVILAGVFTRGAINQLQRNRFKTLYFSAEQIAEAFQRVGIDARVAEDTKDEVVAERIAAWEALSEEKRTIVPTSLIEIDSEEFRSFFDALKMSVTRQVVAVRVLPLHGLSVEWPTPERAVEFIAAYDETKGEMPVTRYEIEIRFNNGDKISGEFGEKSGAIEFLGSY